jgi:glycosyltransferase involved in cell wall biosynthesis
MPALKPRVAVVAAIPLSLQVFMRPHLQAMASRYAVTAICSGNEKIVLESLPPAVDFRPVSICRKISLWRDLVALWQLIVLFGQERYTLVHSITPKAGLLAMCAAWLCGIPFRVHVFTGQVWATRNGISRFFLKSLDRLIAALATHVLTDSHSQRQFLIDQGVVGASQIKVLADGSICGVDATRFRPDPEARCKRRSELCLPENALVGLFLGRLTRDKGIVDLAQAFVRIAQDNPNFNLLLVGPDEEFLMPVLQKILSPYIGQVRFVGMTDCPQEYMAAADILFLPSYREGFGSVVIEAAAVGMPAVASRIYGLSDAVDDGKTGLLHEPGCVSSIESAMRTVVSDADLRSKMGINARARALAQFSTSRLVTAQMAFYDSLFVTDRGG